MKFHCFGDKSKPCMVFVHGMGSNYYSSYRFAKYFSDRYYLVLPTLDEHCEGNDLLKNTEFEAKKIINFLKENNIKELVLYHGTSMGAIIGMKFLELNEIKVNKYFFDGGPFMKGGPLLKSILSSFVKKIIRKFDRMSYEEITHCESLSFLKDEGIDVSKLYPEYKFMFKQYLKKKTVYRLFTVCFSCKFPKLDEETQKKIIFFYSKGEPPRLSRKKLLKNYSNSTYLDWDGKGHTEFQNNKPKEYYQYLVSNLKL